MWWQFPIDFFSKFVSFDAVQCALENGMAVFFSIFCPKQPISFFQKIKLQLQTVFNPNFRHGSTATAIPNWFLLYICIFWRSAVCTGERNGCIFEYFLPKFLFFKKWPTYFVYYYSKESNTSFYLPKRTLTVESVQDFFDQVGHQTTNASIRNKYFFTK